MADKFRVNGEGDSYQEYLTIEEVPEGVECIIIPIYEPTPEEMQAAQWESDVDEETQKYIKRTNDGIEAYAKISAEFRLAKLNGIISEEAHGIIEDVLIPVRNEVLAGQWISGLQKLQTIGGEIIGGGSL